VCRLGGFLFPRDVTRYARVCVQSCVPACVRISLVSSCALGRNLRRDYARYRLIRPLRVVLRRISHLPMRRSNNAHSRPSLTYPPHIQADAITLVAGFLRRMSTALFAKRSSTCVLRREAESSLDCAGQNWMFDLALDGEAVSKRSVSPLTAAQHSQLSFSSARRSSTVLRLAHMQLHRILEA
jgi:hypothetical protein